MKRLLLVLGLLLPTCAPSQTQIETAIAQTVIAQVTPISTATNTPEPTNTLKPTNTPQATNTPRSTNTPRPTRTPRPTLTPSPIPEPKVYEGRGDSILDVENPFGAAVIHITGNDAGSYFGVKNYDADNNQIDLLVNTTDPYDGYRPLDWLDAETTVRLGIEAVGNWRIEISPLALLEVNVPPKTVTGSGDSVIFFCCGGTPDTVKISGNSCGSYFGVVGWGASRELFVNETDPYEGISLVPNDLPGDNGGVLFEIQAECDWSIIVTTK